MAMLSPIAEVRAFADKNITKGRMPFIAGPAKQIIPAVYFSGEQHAVAVVWEHKILHLIKFFKVLCIRHADSRAMVAVTPGDIIAAIHKTNPGIVSVYKMADFPDRR